MLEIIFQITIGSFEKSNSVRIKRFRFVGLIKTLQAINGTSWHDTFSGLWIAALRLVQRVCICFE